MAPRVKRKPTPKRSYSSTVRQEQAARTRARITAAARHLFIDQGYGRTTIKAIAEAAGVAPDTVYATFGSKVRVLTAVLDAGLAPPGVNVMDRPEAHAVRDDPDQRGQIERFARDIASLSTRTRPIYEVLRTAGAVDADAGDVHREMEQHRLDAMGRLAGWLAEHGSLRIDIDRARDVIFTVASPDVARLLCDVRGWSEEEHATWMSDTLAAALLPPR
jgi:AcrR family transcriptional regulator